MLANARPRATRGPLPLLTLLAVTSLAAATLACGGAGGGNTVKIGLNAELTGEMPAVGASSKNAAEMFVEQVNGRGGLDVGGKKMKLELVTADNAAKADQAAAAAQRLSSQDQVVAMIGPNASVAAIPAGEIAESLGVPMITPWSTNPQDHA